MMSSQEIAMKNLVLIGAVAALLAACATTPPPSEEVAQARAEIATLAAEPLAQSAAGTDLEAARRSLQEAETAQQKNEPPEVVNHLGYIALRHAQAGEAR